MPKFHGISARFRVDALSFAAANAMLEEMRCLADDGADLNGVASGGFTALATSCRLGMTRSAELLIGLGADMDLPSRDDLTPLMLACSKGKSKGSRIAIKLIEAGARVNYVRQSDGMTALKFAAKNATPEVIQALIDSGADIDGPPGTSQTALMLAARGNNVATLRVLVENGADVDRPCRQPWAENRTALGLAELEKRQKAATYLRTMTSRTS